MSEHIRKITGSKAESFLFKLTDTRLKGIAVGTAVTSVIQSSSAVCAMAVSLVESNIMQLSAAIPVILGTILGTSVTGWLIAYSSLDFGKSYARFFSAEVIAAVCAVLGTVFKLFVRNKKVKRTGEILLGFSILMLGINTISAGVEPLKNNEQFTAFLRDIKAPIIMFTAGILIAVVFQSASAAVGILQTVSLSGFITLSTAFSLLAGIGIGAAFPVMLTAAGKGARVKRAAFSYLLADAFGAMCFGTIFFILLRIFPSIRSIIMNPVSIAALNTVYRFLIVISLLPFTPQIEKLCEKAFPNNRIALRIAGGQSR